MKINSITGQNFVGKKFRIPIKKVSTKLVDGPVDWGDFPVDCVKEFSNPKAKKLYNQAQKAQNIKDRAALLSQMGEYRIIDNSAEKLKNKFLTSKLL